MSTINPYSAGMPYITARKANQSDSSLPEIPFLTLDEYRRMIEELEGGNSEETVDPSTKLYNGSTARAALSDTEIAALANKYDVHNMSGETFDAFLDDLENMGALSRMEKDQLGYHGKVTVGYLRNGKLEESSTSGMWAAPNVPGGSEKLFDRQDANGDISRWINDRIQWERGYSSDPVQRKTEEDYEELHRVLAKIINRMGAQQKNSAGEAEKKELVRQLADRNSDFYTNMRTNLKAQVDKNKEDEEQQAIVDALGAVLDALSGKTDVSGNKESVNKAATDLTKKIGERIARLRQKNPDDPEIAKLENMLKRLQEMGIYIDLGDTDDIWQDEDETFETLTQFLIRRQAEETSAVHPTKNEVNEPA